MVFLRKIAPRQTDIVQPLQVAECHLVVLHERGETEAMLLLDALVLLSIVVDGGRRILPHKRKPLKAYPLRYERHQLSTGAGSLRRWYGWVNTKRDKAV